MKEKLFPKKKSIFNLCILMPVFQFATEEDISTDKINHLCSIINEVYNIGEGDLFQGGLTRTNPSDLEKDIRERHVVIAKEDDLVIGCVYVNAGLL